MTDMQKLMRKNKWSLHCNFCGKDVLEDPLDYYMVKDEIWNEICANDYVSPTHVLCRHCAEEILGREFTDDDFIDAPINYEYLNNETKILKNIYYKKKPQGEIQ